MPMSKKQPLDNEVDDNEPSDESLGDESTEQSVRSALTLRFGSLIDRMEKRRMLSIGKGDRMVASNCICLDPAEVDPGREVAALLFEGGGRASIPEMLGRKQFADLVAQVEALAKARDKSAVGAVMMIPDDAPDKSIDAWLLAGMMEIAVGKLDRPMSLDEGVRKFVSAFSGAVRAWWAKTELDQKLARYGQALQLTPRDIGALAVYAVSEGDD